jgi:small conductance mechanosensitive channel
MENWQETIQNGLTEYGPGVLGFVAVLVIGWFVAKIITGAMRKGMTRADVDATLIGFVCNLSYMALMALVVISALGQLGVNTTSFAAIIGAAGLAIGFALQGSLGNFAAGVMLIIFRPFKAGDFVEAGGVSGIVEDVQVFATIIRSGDNKEITVPNGSITGGSIVNYSAKPTRRVDMVFGIGYDDDIKQAKQILHDVIAADDRILAEPQRQLRRSPVGELGRLLAGALRHHREREARVRQGRCVDPVPADRRAHASGRRRIVGDRSESENETPVEANPTGVSCLWVALSGCGRDCQRAPLRPDPRRQTVDRDAAEATWRGTTTSDSPARTPRSCSGKPQTCTCAWRARRSWTSVPRGGPLPGLLPPDASLPHDPHTRAMRQNPASLTYASRRTGRSRESSQTA